jgi:hypothetical protein
MPSNTATSSINFYAGGKCMSSQYSESVVSNVLRSEMTGGYAKQAKRASRQVKQRDVVYLYSTTEFDAFKTWFKDTAKDGSLFFNYTLPESANNDIIDARIMNGTYTAAPVNARMNFFYVTLQIESYT